MAHAKLVIEITPEWVRQHADDDNGIISVGGLAHRMGWLRREKHNGQRPVNGNGKKKKPATRPTGKQRRHKPKRAAHAK